MLTKSAGANGDDEKSIRGKTQDINDAEFPHAPSDHPSDISPKAEAVLSNEAMSSWTKEPPAKRPRTIDLVDRNDDFAIDLADGEEEEDPIDLTDDYMGVPKKSPAYDSI